MEKMMMHTTKVTLDGYKNGIAAYVRSRNGYIKRSDEKSNLFSNFKSLEARLFREGLQYHDVSFCFIIHDVAVGKAVINLNEALKTENGWKVSRYESIYGNTFLHIYDITEIANDQVVDICYITTKESGTHDKDKDPRYEYSKKRKLKDMCITVAKELASYQSYGCSIVNTKRGTDIKLNNTSAVMHIWSNNKLIDYNSDIKKIREVNNSTDRCLPFLKDQDKYGSLYMFITCESSDITDDAYTRKKISMVKESFIALLNDKFPDMDVKLVPCEFAGKVLLIDPKIEEE